ncbi:uncharacterized protein LOC116769333 isoform X1 [Danaus plexippus]|uniref:uncharacterized protein LOC116769333 isoform X1 n=1 Tax=Danaus plexippus TaxID=13037 RepID=UPI002AB1C2C3|nr:uncharacterized protein LOC116769333 isoform X1 [Danaus plexippus]
MVKILFFTSLLCLTANALGSSDDKFFKKYAMMKIYESCFGPEVVKQIRKEMKDAYAKCSSPPSMEEAPNQQDIPSALFGKLPPGFAIDPSSQTITKPLDGPLHSNENELQKPDLGQIGEKLGAAMDNIFPFRPTQRPPFQPPSPYLIPGGQFRPFSPPYYQFPFNPMYYPPAPQYNPFAYQQQPFQQQYFPQPLIGNSRMSRDLNLRDRLELISRGPNAGRVRNITCVMQELGYIDHNLEPNYDQITQRINNLPVSSELKGDIQDGLQFCQKFSQCVPDSKRDVTPLWQELIKPMFFFRCYKHKKLEACIMKDIRERFAGEDDLDTESGFRSLSRAARSLREEPISDPRLEALDEMAVYFYDYLSGGSGLDYDLYL